MREQGY